MQNADWDTVKQLLDEALEQPIGDVQAFLEEECGDKPHLVDEVLSLLGQRGVDDDFFEAGAAAALASGDGEEAEDLQRIGPYVLREQIGSGGMGAVFRAVRSDAHYEREVALKIVPPGVGADLNRRFWAERQILAGLEHPQIARLYDGGWSADGRPYFAMELVDGEPIDAYCDRHNVSIDDRIRLFIQAVEAVSFAHRRLVVHRDLKPGNVLVNVEGNVKLVDFGIAKLLDEDNPITPRTRHGHRHMTPEYAAPEHVLGEPISTAADVYSLGVILYELVTGSRPYAVDRSSPSRLESSVCRAAIPRPSERVLREDEEKEGAGAAAARRRLHRRLRGDLDTIIMTCLEKDPDDRYSSADELARDLGRFLRSAPISARPPSAAYQVRKFVRRHRVSVVAVAAFVALVLAYAVTVTVQWRQLEIQRARTERNALKAERVAGFLKGLFRDASPGLEHSSDYTDAALSLVDQGARKLEDLSSEPLIYAELAETLGEIYYDLGSLAMADSLYAKSLDLRRAHLPDDDPDVAASLHGLANLRYSQRNHQEAVAYFDTAARILRTARGEDDPDYAQSMIWRSFAMPTDAPGRDAAFIHALELLEDIHGPDSDEVADALAFFALRQNDASHADTLFAQALKILELRPEENAVKIAEVFNDLGLRLEEEDPERSRQLLREAIRRYGDELGRHHPATLLAMNNLAAVLHDAGRPAEAEPLLRLVLDGRRDALPAQSLQIAYTAYRLGRVSLDLNRPAEAETLLREGTEILSDQLPEDDTRVVLARHYLALSLRDQGRHASARGVLEENRARVRDHYGADHHLAELTQTALESLSGP